MRGVQEMVVAAKAGIENLTVADLAGELGSGRVLLVDLREPAETCGGVIPGALLAPRGLLEFHADPAAPDHLEDFRQGRRIVLYCATGARSALGAKSLQELGYRDVAHLEGGYDAWLAKDQPVADAAARPKENP